ncbi:uncharacterized protein LOC108049699 [Drosophila rhopaloa]|uniref:Uncharacterized protein LOC108049699 n=1 Tax=Drosophila rhopaloa TaxID=1041015 RepID=A0A6P4FBI7_DRORH|nr:uncharacterized protein LOC108049699 [Drosophila rhopaloa]
MNCLYLEYGGTKGTKRSMFNNKNDKLITLDRFAESSENSLYTKVFGSHGVLVETPKSSPKERFFPENRRSSSLGQRAWKRGENKLLSGMNYFTPKKQSDNSRKSLALKGKSSETYKPVWFGTSENYMFNRNKELASQSGDSCSQKSLFQRVFASFTSVDAIPGRISKSSSESRSPGSGTSKSGLQSEELSGGKYLSCTQQTFSLDKSRQIKEEGSQSGISLMFDKLESLQSGECWPYRKESFQSGISRPSEEPTSATATCLKCKYQLETFLYGVSDIVKEPVSHTRNSNSKDEESYQSDRHSLFDCLTSQSEKSGFCNEDSFQSGKLSLEHHYLKIKSFLPGKSSKICSSGTEFSQFEKSPSQAGKFRSSSWKSYKSKISWPSTKILQTPLSGNPLLTKDSTCNKSGIGHSSIICRDNSEGQDLQPKNFSSTTESKSVSKKDKFKERTSRKSDSEKSRVKSLNAFYSESEDNMDLKDVLNESEDTRFYRRMVGEYSSVEAFLKDFTKRKAIELRERRNKKFPDVANKW